MTIDVNGINLNDLSTANPSGVLNSATLIMGPSGSGKSSLLATAAEYVYETYGLISQYALSDGGGFPMQMQALVRLGVVRLWRMRTRSTTGLAFETCQRACMGWWPKRIHPSTGEAAPGVELVAPMTTRIGIVCSNGHPMATLTHLQQFKPATCPTCRVPQSLQTITTVVTTERTKGFEKVGALLLDGLSSMCSWMLDDLAERSGKNEIGGEKGALGGTIVSGGMAWGQNNRAQVGFVQNRAEALALAAGGVPGLKIPAIMTALTAEGSDDSQLQIRGPLLAGQAKTAVAPQWFGDTMETAVVTTNEGKKYRRLYLQPYVDAGGVYHLCRVRSYPGQLPAFLEDEDSGDGVNAFKEFSLGHFYRSREVAMQNTEAEYRLRYPHAVDVVEGEVVVGDDVLASSTGKASVASAPVGRPAVASPVATPAPAAGPKAIARPAVARAAAKPAPKPVGTPQPPHVSPAPVVEPAAVEDPVGVPAVEGEAPEPGVDEVAGAADPATPEAPAAVPEPEPAAPAPTPAPVVARPAAQAPKPPVGRAAPQQVAAPPPGRPPQAVRLPPPPGRKPVVAPGA
jgi:hypothetical protein